MNRQNEALGIESFFRVGVSLNRNILTSYHAEEMEGSQHFGVWTQPNVYKCLLMYWSGLRVFRDTQHIFSWSVCLWECAYVIQQFRLVHSRHINILKAFRYISSLFGIIIIASYFITRPRLRYLSVAWCGSRC